MFGADQRPTGERQRDARDRVRGVSVVADALCKSRGLIVPGVKAVTFKPKAWELNRSASVIADKAVPSCLWINAIFSLTGVYGDVARLAVPIPVAIIGRLTAVEGMSKGHSTAGSDTTVPIIEPRLSLYVKLESDPKSASYRAYSCVSSFTP